MTPKHIPLRTCVQCKQVRPKRELVRIVRTLQGEVQIDERGKTPGRGAYLCRSRTCWQDALSHGRLEHALKIQLELGDRQRLDEYAQRLPCPETQASPEDAQAPIRGQGRVSSKTIDKVASKARGTVLNGVKGEEAAASVEG